MALSEKQLERRQIAEWIRAQQQCTWLDAIKHGVFVLADDDRTKSIDYWHSQLLHMFQAGALIVKDDVLVMQRFVPGEQQYRKQQADLSLDQWLKAPPRAWTARPKGLC